MTSSGTATNPGNEESATIPIRGVAGLSFGVFAMSLLSFILPDIALDTSMANAVVWLTDTASKKDFPILAILVVALVVSRPGLSRKRRTVEAGASILAVALVGMAITVLNENTIKPILEVARPNIVTLAGYGALGPEIPDADAFYAIGDKAARRAFLAEVLPTIETPELSPTVRDHWAYETGYSFPSGHSIAAATLATAIGGIGLTWLGGWRRRVALILGPLWAIGVIYSRILLGVHSPLDVVAGTLIGIGCGIIVLRIFRACVAYFCAA